MTRPTVAIVDLKALRANFALVKSLAPQANIIPMVKANAYGHGMVEVCRALSHSAPAFGVASIDEALVLREAGIKQPILLLEGTFSSDEVEIASDNNFMLMVENSAQKDAIINASISRPVSVWLGVDTGMHRLGFQPQEATQTYFALSNTDNVAKPIVAASHFACADDLGSSVTKNQMAIFDRWITTLNPAAGDVIAESLANSAAILAWPETHRDWQRPGYMLYGNSPFSEDQDNANKLQPVMSLQSAVISLRHIASGESVGYTANWTAGRDSIIATITVGYGDGYPRQAPNGTPVLVNGARCPLVGRVSMDMITVDVTDLNLVSIGDKVILWGPELSVNEIAEYCNTIGYELLTRMPSRVPRVYSN
jgi:alanine racemase